MRKAGRLGAVRVWAAAVTALTAVGALVVLGPVPAARAAPASFSFSPNPIAPQGTLREASTAVVTVTAVDQLGAPTPGAAVYLTFTSTATPPGAASVDGTPLKSAPQMFVADRNGRVTVTYTTATPQCAPVGAGSCPSGGYPTGGIDTITATDAASNPAVRASDSYDYAGLKSRNADQYFFGPDPIAGPAELSGSQMVTVTLVVLTSTGQPEPSKTVYLSFAPTAGGGTVSSGSGCSAAQLGSTPTSCTTDSDGQIRLTYTAGGPGGQPPPTSGKDVITVQDAATNPSESATDTYDYAAPSYTFDRTPIAAAGTIGSNQTVDLTVTATDASGSVLVGAPVYLSLGRNSVGSAIATGAVASIANPTDSSALTGLPTPFDTDANGHIVVEYRTPANGPSGSPTDAVHAQSSQANPRSSASVTYTYAPPEYTFNPSPIASTGQLGANQSVNVTLSVAGSAVPAAPVYLSFSGAPGGGTAKVGTTTLTSDPSAFVADTSGHVDIVYTAPADRSWRGSDVITAQDTPSSPANVSADVYESSGAGGGGTGGAQGYWLAARDGGIFTFGSAPFYGSHGGSPLNSPITAMLGTPDGHGYWFVGGDGGIFTYGDASFQGSMGGKPLAAPVVGMATTPDGGGYWLVASDGGIFNFGDAHFYGAASGSPYGPAAGGTPIIGMAATPDGSGYWEVAANGAVFSFGDAHWYGGTDKQHLNAPIVAMAATATGNGYWLVGTDGGVFTFGDAFFYGSTGNLKLVAPIVGMAATANGAGYWFVASDGGVFAYGNASFQGSMGGKHLNQPVVGMAGT